MTDTMEKEKIRAKMPVLEAEKRKNNFKEVELGFSKEQAVYEARRCLSCDVEICVACKICAEICPTAVISIKCDENAENRKFVSSYKIDFTKCMFCGLCVEACPTKTLYHSKKYEEATFDKKSLIWDMNKLTNKK